MVQKMNDSRVAIVVASTGRPGELDELLVHLGCQTVAPDYIVLSVHERGDLPPNIPDGVRVIFGEKGAAAQRNRGLELIINKSDIVVFIDDDYLPTKDMISGVIAVFSELTDVVGCNGRLLADGINTPGITYEAANALLKKHELSGESKVNIRCDLDGLYGCNMAFRAAAIGAVRFDENLPLYSWQEDIDFAAQLLGRGRLIRTDGFTGVHRGVKRGRGSGVKFGYSQIVNPIYLARKKTMRWPYALKIIRNNVAANFAKMFFPEAWVDRRGRAVGNLLGLCDVFLGKDDPRKITRLG
jgi:GT2 family glycosyltransferase